MSNTLIRDVVIIAGLGVATALFLNNRPAAYAILGLDMPNATKAVKTAHALPQKQVQVNGSVVSIPKNPRDGQYWAEARVNSGYVRFLVDTGASAVALTLEDARKAGLRERDMVFNVPVATAGGTNYAARVQIDSISVGGITLRDINSLVIKDGLNTSLLGMTYLGQLQKVEATPSALILRL